MSSQNISNSTIMFTDIVGYSSMVNKDQKHALDLLDTHDAIIEPIIEKNKGIIIKKIGDAIFAEFESPDKCYDTAISIQNELTKRNLVSQANDYINIRIGLHTGDVIRKDNDLFGHDVNLCSRIESVAMKDSIAASAEFIKQVTNNSCLSREIGYVKLKNITHPQKLYRIYINKEDYDQETSRQLYDKCNDNGVSIVDMDSYKIEESSSIGMLYINNIGDVKDETFSYNLSAELISDLENINEVRCPSFNQILNYKKTDLGYGDIARQLEVEYILSGNMFKKDNSLKITCELLCINTGNVIWSDSFEESLSNIKNIRKQIINSILNEFKFEMPQKLLDIYSEKISSNDKAIELYLKGKYCYNFLESGEDLNKGKDFLEKALELDSNLVEAISIHGMILHRLGNFDAAESALLKAQDIAINKNYNQGLADIYKYLQSIYSDKGQYDKALIFVEKGLKIQIDLHNNLFEAQLRMDYANLLNHMGKPQNSIEQNKQAILLLKKIEEDRLIGISNAILFNTYFTMFDYSKAIEYGKKALRLFRKLKMSNFEGRILVIIGEAYSKVGDYESMKYYADLASPIIRGFNDLFLLGKLDFFESEYSLKNESVNEAIDSIDKSVDWYDLADNQIYKIEMMVEKLKLLVEFNRLEEANSYLKKIQTQSNKVKGSYDFNLINTIDFFIKSRNNKDVSFDLDDLQNKIKSSKDESKNIYIYWYLARIYQSMDKDSLSSEYHNKAKAILNPICDRFEDDKQKEYFRNTFYHKRIFSDLDEAQIDDDASDAQSVFAFCPKCGFNNEKSFQFCPSCGNNLKS